MTTSDSWNLSLLALCVWREARGESREGRIAVCWSIRNRVDHPSWWGTSYPSVILKPFQYSSFNVGDPNATKFPLEHDSAWMDCLQMSSDVMGGFMSDPTSGATHYYATSIVPPDWAKTGEFKVQIGSHRFYKAA